MPSSSALPSASAIPFARRDEDDAPFDAHARKPRSKWAASVNGFSVHAGTVVAAHNRVGLEKLVRYCARPGVSLERLSQLPDGRFAYRVKHPVGTKTHRVMDAMELMARLASIVAPPRYPLVRFHGLFAPGSRDRARVVPGRAPGPARCCAEHAQPVPPSNEAALESPVVRPRTVDPMIERAQTPPRARIPGGTRTPWAMLMKHAFGLDVLACRCGGRMELVAVVQDPIEVRRYLASAGLALRDASVERNQRTTPTRAWDPVPLDEVFVEHAGRDPCRDELPPDDWTA